MIIYSAKEAARKMGVGADTVRELVKSGRLKGVRFGNGLRISEEAISNFFLEGGDFKLPKKTTKQPQPEALRKAAEKRKQEKEARQKQQS